VMMCALHARREDGGGGSGESAYHAGPELAFDGPEAWHARV
jgi:hypothetical protein